MSFLVFGVKIFLLNDIDEIFFYWAKLKVGHPVLVCLFFPFLHKFQESIESKSLGTLS